MAKAKKKTKRSVTKNPNLTKNLYSKIKQQFFDIDYIDKLSDKEKEWLNHFMGEYLNANLKEGKKKLHRTKALKKDCFDRNNARNRDIYGRSRVGGKLDSLDEQLIAKLEEEHLDEEFEERVIDKIDNEN
jgi:hypothetical protein